MSNERGSETLRKYEEINDRIRRGEATVLTADEFIDVVESSGLQKAAKEVDVVTTGTFGAMCRFANEPSVARTSLTKAELPANNTSGRCSLGRM